MFGSLCLHFVLILYTRYYILSIRASSLCNPVNINFQPFYKPEFIHGAAHLHYIIIFLFQTIVFIIGNN